MIERVTKEYFELYDNPFWITNFDYCINPRAISFTWYIYRINGVVYERKTQQFINEYTKAMSWELLKNKG